VCHLQVFVEIWLLSVERESWNCWREVNLVYLAMFSVHIPLNLPATLSPQSSQHRQVVTLSLWLLGMYFRLCCLSVLFIQ
jgi:hypothetical protein